MGPTLPPIHGERKLKPDQPIFCCFRADIWLSRKSLLPPLRGVGTVVVSRGVAGMSATKGTGNGRPEDRTEEQIKAIRLHVQKIIRVLVKRQRKPTAS